VDLYCSFSTRHWMAPQETAKLRTAFFGQLFTSLRKDSVANYALMCTLFSPTVSVGCALPGTKRFVVPSVGGATRFANCGGNFPKRKISAAELCQILRILTIYIAINSTHV